MGLAPTKDEVLMVSNLRDFHAHPREDSTLGIHPKEIICIGEG